MNVCPLCRNARWVTPALEHYHGEGVGQPCPLCNVGTEAEGWNRSCLACVGPMDFMEANPDDEAVVLWRAHVAVRTDHISEYLVGHYHPRATMVALSEWDQANWPFGYGPVSRHPGFAPLLTEQFCPELIARVSSELDEPQLALYLSGVCCRIDHRVVYFELYETSPSAEEDVWRSTMEQEEAGTLALMLQTEDRYRMEWTVLG